MNPNANKSAQGIVLCLIFLQLFSAIPAQAQPNVRQEERASLNIKIEASKDPRAMSKEDSKKLLIKNQNDSKDFSGGSDFPSSINSVAGGADAGGSDMDRAEVQAIQTRLEDGSLKRAMLNYLKTIEIGKIQNQEVKLLLEKISLQQLENDILQSHYLTDKKCFDEKNKSVHASARFDDLAGSICFDVQKISTLLNGLHYDEILLKLAAIALHEHIHHFQKKPATDDLIELLEKQAYTFQVYIWLTAKNISEPLLVWHETKEINAKCEDIILKLFFASKKAGQLFINDNSENKMTYSDQRDYSNNLFLSAISQCAKNESEDCRDAKNGLIWLKDEASRIGELRAKIEALDLADRLNRLDQLMALETKYLKEGVSIQHSFNAKCLSSHE